jgi:MFS family permease
LLFGFLADRIGRKRALMLSILTYSICSFASGLSTTVLMLAVFRFILGLGMGGEWNTGATLVAETWPDELRAKAIAVVQSSWAIGYALAALVAGVVLRYANWRMVFFVGILPAIVTLWIRNGVPESEMWLERNSGGHFGEIKRFNHGWQFGTQGNDSFFHFRRALRQEHHRSSLLNFFGLFAWWGLFTWIPPYLSLPVAQGGRGFGIMRTTTLLIVLNLFGMFPGYLSFGWVADHLGRRKSFMLYLFAAALLVPLYAMARAHFFARAGRDCGFLWDGIFLRLGADRQRDLSHRFAGARLGLYLQRRAGLELRRPLDHRMGRPDKGTELGFLSMWRSVSSGEHDGYAVAGDQRGEALE